MHSCPNCGTDEVECEFNYADENSYEDYYECKCIDCGYKWSEEA